MFKNNAEVLVLLAVPEQRIALLKNQIQQDLQDFIKLENIKFFEFPVLRLVPDFENLEILKLNNNNLNNFNYFVFVSPYGTQLFFENLSQDSEIYKNLKEKKINILSVGDSVSKIIKSFNFEVNFQPSIFNQESLFEEFFEKNKTKISEENSKILLICGKTKNNNINNIYKNFSRFEIYKSISNFIYLNNPDNSRKLKNLENILCKFSELNCQNKFIILSSPTGIESFHEFLSNSKLKKNINIIFNSKILCLGDKTREAFEFYFPDYKQNILTKNLSNKKYSYSDFAKNIKTQIQSM